MIVQILKCDNRKFTIVGSLIKLIQRTSYSHYAIGFTSETGEYLIIDATSKNVAIRASRQYSSHYKIVESIDVKIDATRAEFFAWFEPLLGISYGYMQLIGILVRSKKLGRGIICNELVLRMFAHFFGYTDRMIDIRDLNYTSKMIDIYKLKM